MRTLHGILVAAYLVVSSCYSLPVWHGEVVVHPLERSSIKTCGKGALTAVGRERVSREPYLQSTTHTSTIIAWGAKEAHGEVVLKEPDGKLVAAVPATESSSGDVRVLFATFDKLQPGHLYCYQVVDQGVALTEPAPLTTAPEPGLKDPIRFVALGDTGTGGDAQKAIAQRMTEVPFDFMLFLGDIAYDRGSQRQLQNYFFSIYANILRFVPAYPTIGNHERRTSKGKPYFDAFVLPQPERYYSFDWGDVHFVAIDTTHRDSAQVAWLIDDLAKTKQRWKIVYGHHPPYTNSFRGPQTWIRKTYAKILTDAKVDIVLTGHEHQYERFRIANVNYIISGGGGGQLTRFFPLHYSLKKASVHHFLSFEVTADTLVMKAIDIDGKIVEKLELDKPSDDAVPKAKVNDKPEVKQSPIAPEKETVPDEKLHDGPDDDEKEQHEPPQKVPNAPDKPTPPGVTSAALEEPVVPAPASTKAAAPTTGAAPTSGAAPASGATPTNAVTR